MRVNGTAVALGRHGVMIRGPSGAGKSDLALRLLATPVEGYPGLAIPPLASLALVADDYVDIAVRNGVPVMTAPTTIACKIEVRGLGLACLPSVGEAELRLVVDLAAKDTIERMPEPRTLDVLGHAIPIMTVAPFEASAPLKILIALHHPIER